MSKHPILSKPWKMQECVTRVELRFLKYGEVISTVMERR